MKRLKNIFYIAATGLMLLQTSCKKDGISSFSGEAAVNFTSVVPLQYSFLGNPEDEYIQEIEVKIMGNTADYDRHFNAVAVEDGTTTAKSNQYQILGGVVKAGEYTGKLSIKLLNSEVLNTTTVNLKVKLVDAEDFKAGNLETREFTVGWTNQIVVPAWTYYRYYFTAVASNNAYRLIVETTGIKVLAAADFRLLGQITCEAMGTKFGDYVKQWNKDHPNDHLKHDTGTQAGQDIVPLYYTKSKFD
ncbi:DUF4843 domain-containing protein [Pedobacter sp.]|uniref:DUF4843 domain-containing protein n=1 Tax=Pedobacter sp. TaxID=1411316 RepID=UPI003D7FB0D9